MNREKTIVKTSVFGILVNAVLVAFKMTVGLIAGSIAVVLDAVNNLSDALSSIITIIGTKLAGKKPDKKHPFGHGRIEYITSVIIAVIILLAGATAMKESITKIITPEKPDFSIVPIIIIAVAVVVKFVFGRYVKSVGKKINSGALIASGQDALFDSILSLATLAGALVSFIWGFNIDGYLGALISVIILRAGIGILSDTLSNIIGKRTDKEIVDNLKSLVMTVPEVHGVYDVILHDYGPNKTIGSLHVEVSGDMTAKEIHKLTRGISALVYNELGIILTVGIYAASDSGGISDEIKQKLTQIVDERKEIIQMHGFYVDEANKSITFDLIIDFSADAEKIKNEVVEKLKESYPDYTAYAILDTDFTD